MFVPCKEDPLKNMSISLEFFHVDTSRFLFFRIMTFFDADSKKCGKFFLKPNLKKKWLIIKLKLGDPIYVDIQSINSFS